MGAILSSTNSLKKRVMPNIKVLPLEYWMQMPPFMEDDFYPMEEWEIVNELKKYPETQPIFRRDGIYMCGALCWFEVNGKAFNHPRKDFIHALNTANGGELSDEKMQALREIIKVGLATKQQRQAYYFADHAKECRDIYRMTRKRMLDICREECDD